MCINPITLIVCRLIVVIVKMMAACQQTRALYSEDDCASSDWSADCHRKSSLNWRICTATMWAESSVGNGMSASSTS